MRATIVVFLLLTSTSAFGVQVQQILGPWVRNHDSDPLDDAQICIVRIEGAPMPYPWFYFRTGSGPSVSVVGDVYPGELESFRVDKNKAISGKEGLAGNSAKRLISQIRQGGSVMLVRFIEWPSGAPVLREVELAGIVPHLDGCLKHIQAP